VGLGHVYRDAECFKLRRISCTPAERDWLYEQRLRAMKECNDIRWQKARRTPLREHSWRCRLEIHRRCKDGSLLASVVIRDGETGTSYRRNLRAHHTLGSTSGRGIHLRRASKHG
jgi:hypothetical protein